MTKVSPTNLLSNVEGTNSIRDIKPPVELPAEWGWLIWAAILLAVVALGIWLWQKQVKRPERLPEEALTPPHLRAKRRLREALMFIDDPNEFCTRVSSALRWYLEERFDFHAPERTTEEFLLELQGTNLLNSSQKLALSDFLQRCDLVKFARYEPTEPELKDLHAAALRLIEETEPSADAPLAPGARQETLATEHKPLPPPQ